jgi:hypothetical protein
VLVSIADRRKRLCSARRHASRLRACKRSSSAASRPDHPVTMRKVDGWQTLAGKPADQIIDLAA